MLAMPRAATRRDAADGFLRARSIYYLRQMPLHAPLRYFARYAYFATLFYATLICYALLVDIDIIVTLDDYYYADVDVNHFCCCR